jgi:hypothetical protein
VVFSLFPPGKAIYLLDVLENCLDHGKPGLDLRERRAEDESAVGISAWAAAAFAAISR